MLAIAWLSDGLHQLDRTSFNREIIAKFKNKSKPNALCIEEYNKVAEVDPWHLKLRHASFDSLSHIEDNLIKKNLQFCELCLCAKQHGYSFSRSEIPTVKNFQLMHLIIWGPYSILAMTGAQYFLSIVDDYIRVTWIILLKCKSKVANAIKVFLEMVETQFSAKVQKIMSDNRTEFINQ